MTATRQTVDLSVVVAAPEAGPNLLACLAELRTQIAPLFGEIVVVDGSGSHAAFGGARALPPCRLLELPRGTGVHRLWKAGIEASQGRIVALTIEQCVPGPGWAEAVLRAHTGGPAVIGGSMEIGPRAGLVDRAIYFCRYSRYIPAPAPRWLDDLAGDNCSYKRAALDKLHPEAADGFWETFVHRELRRLGERLLWEPSIRMYYAGPIGGFACLKTRLAHGRYFAARRGRTLSRGERFVRAAASGLVPFLLLARIAARVWRVPRRRSPFLRCLPLVAAFLAAWSAGECLGFLLGRRTEPTRPAEESSMAREVV